ncbi:MAG: S1C family serine protease [Bacillota bacterium]
MDDERFYKEEVEKSTPKYGKRTIALVLVIGLILGVYIGLNVEKYSENYGIGSEVVYATENEQENKNNIITNQLSPVVPIAKKVSPSIVAIEIKSAGRDFFGQRFESKGTGSGIIIDNQGHIVTNNHVVEGAHNLTVILKDGTKLDAVLVGRDATSDLAVIKVEKDGLPVAELGDSSKIEVGELAVAIGSPMSTEFAGSVTAGIISGIDRQVALGDKTLTLIQTDAAINPGNSGGALVNGEGKVIGINTVKFAQSAVEGMGFAIPINEAKPIIEELIKNKKIVRPYLGIQGITVTKEDAEIYDLPQGIYVGEVVPFSGAEQAGIKKGEVITKVNGKRVYKIEELVDIISKSKVGDILQLEVYDQYNKARTVSVKLKGNISDR